MARANIGTVAPRMAAKPAWSRSIEKASRLKGMAEFSAPSRTKLAAWPRSSQGKKTAVAPAMRSSTSGRGPKLGAATRMNR